MLSEDVVEIITDELANFTASYFMMSSLSHESLTLEAKDYDFQFGQYSYWMDKSYFHARHYIYKTGRTKLRFSFHFYVDELNFALQLVRLLDGYVNYGFSSSNDGYNYSFEFDTGSKANCNKIFEKLNFLV